MKIVLATGIYPPDIGGPATYVKHLAEEFSKDGAEVVVVTYGSEPFDEFQGKEGQEGEKGWKVIRVSKSGGPLLRWKRYAKTLKKHAYDADIVYAFSSVSCGVPLRMVRLTKPKKILRLGGDFFWERHTDGGGMQNLREWYESKPKKMRLMERLLGSFDHIVFSTRFQQALYEEHYPALPDHSVIENAFPAEMMERHDLHRPMRLLFVGRFVGFKNLPALLRAVARTEGVRLTLVGEGPEAAKLAETVSALSLERRVVFVAPVHGGEKRKVFAGHDALILPSLTEISPNVALEARACGLPVLLTAETGLSGSLASGMILRVLRTEDDIVAALADLRKKYENYARVSCEETARRGWKEVKDSHKELFSSMISRV